MGSLKLGDTIAMFSESLDKNIEELKHSQRIAIEELQAEHRKNFNAMTEEHERAVRQLTERLSKAGDDIDKLKSQHEDDIDGLKHHLTSLDEDNQIAQEEKENKYRDKTEQLKKVTAEHKGEIQQLQENLDQLDRENKIAIADLKDNLSKEILENEAGMLQLKEEHEKAIRELRDYHDETTEAIEKRLETMQEHNDKIHNDLTSNHRNSVNELRQEVVDQVVALKEASQSIQVEFDEKLKILTNIMDNEKASNQAKLAEIRQVLDGVQTAVHEKLEETQSVLMNKIRTEFKFNDDGSIKYGLDLEMAIVKEMLEGLSGRVQDMHEKMYDFEQNKRNNLIFYGIQNDENETNQTLANNVLKIIKNVIGMRREVFISMTSRLNTGPTVSNSRPVVVTFENFTDRDDVLKRASLMKDSSIRVTEDMSKSVREARSQLAKFMKKVRRSNPSANCFILYDKLYVGNKIYKWDAELSQVKEIEGEE